MPRWSRRMRRLSFFVAPSSPVAPIFETPLRRLVVILQRNQHTLDQAQWRECHEQNQRQPQNGVDPIGRLVCDFGHQRRKHNNESSDENYKHRRPVACVSEAIVETAMRTRWSQREKSLKQLALPATRTQAAQPAANWQSVCRCRIGHGATSRTKTKGRRNDAALQQVSAIRYSACAAPEPHTYMQANRNSQTTSTKCQYHAANSKPRCCFGVKWPAIARARQTIRNIEPMITWAPWKPVAMKKVAP